MKKTRILAALLCLMMVVCSLPMVASAELSETDYKTIAELMGKANAIPVENHATWYGMNFDFTDNFNQTAGITVSGTSYDNTNGLSFSAGTEWKYYPAGSTQWSPLALGAYTVRFKLTEGATLDFQACKPYDNGRAFVIARNNEIVATEANAAGTGFQRATLHENFAPGTDWVDMVIVTDGSGYKTYMKKATDTTYVHVSTAATYRPGGSWASTGLTITGGTANSYIKHAVMLEGCDVTYNTVEDVLGGPVSTTYSADFDAGFDKDAWTRQGGMSFPAGAECTDEDGLKFAATAGTWNYYAYSGWSPFHNGSLVDAYKPQAVYFKAKTSGTSSGALNVQFRSPDGYRFYIDLKQGTDIGYGSQSAVVTEHNLYKNDGGWIEYLIVPNEAGKANGFEFYAKSGTTGNVWKKISTSTAWRTAGGVQGNTLGITFNAAANSNACLKSVRCYQAAVADDATIPEGATYQWYNEDMNAAPAYANLTATNVSYDGSANFPATTETGDIVYNLAKAEIPVGGYAEFKARSNGYYSAVICDGETSVSFGVNKDYGSVNGAGLFAADVSSNTWRTWRVVRTEAGYNVYSKVDGDNAWLACATNASTTNTTAPSIKLTFSTHMNGSKTGSGQLEYLKIYGPASDDALTLTDGYGTEILNDGATLTYEEDLRYIVKDVSGKMLVVSYEGDDMLKAQIINAADGNDAFVNAKEDGATKVKVFLWDNFNALNPVVPAVTLNL